MRKLIHAAAFAAFILAAIVASAIAALHLPPDPLIADWLNGRGACNAGPTP